MPFCVSVNFEQKHKKLSEPLIVKGCEKKLLRAVKKNVQRVDLMLRCQVFLTHTNNNHKGGRKLREMISMFMVVMVS